MKFDSQFVQHKKLLKYNYKFGRIKGYVLAEHMEDAKSKIKKMPFCLDDKIPKACVISLDDCQNFERK